MTKKKTEKNALQETTQKKNISEAVLSRVSQMQESGGLVLPPDYNAGNALTSAYLKFKETKTKDGRPAEEICTPASVANAFLDMVVQGLTPAKNQCYFIVYKDQLTLQRSYLGTVAAAKRLGGVQEVFAQVVYKGDEFAFEVDPETGKRKITKHEQSLDSIEGGEIRAAYATLVLKDGEVYQEIMTIGEIKKAWNQGQTNGASPAHKNFPQEMAKKTVINRACKLFINTSTDAELVVEAFNKTTANDRSFEEEAPIIDVAAEDIKTAALGELFGDPAPEEPAEAKPEPEAEEPAETWTSVDEEAEAVFEERSAAK